MPLYDYKCPKCDTEKLDVRIPLSQSDDPQACSCGAAMDRILTRAPAVSFRGHTGFRSSGGKDGGWNWSTPRPKPIEGHEVSGEEKKHIEDSATEKYVKQIEGAKNDANTK